MPLLPAKLLNSLAAMRLHIRKPVTGSFQGDRRSPRRGSSVEFSDYREYEPGDDYRHIDWNIYNRLDRLFVKVFAEEQSQNINLLIDTSASMMLGDPPKVHYAKKIAAALGFVALAGGEQARLAAVGAGALSWATPRWRGRYRAVGMMRIVEQFEAAGATNLTAGLSGLRGAGAHADATILISDLLDPDWKTALTALGRDGGTGIVVHLLAAEDWNPGWNGEFELQDAESGEVLEVGLDARGLEAFRRAAQEWLESVRAECMRLGLDCYQLDTSLPIDSFLLGTLREGGLLR